MSIELLFIILDYAGIGFFAYSGGMLAARKSLDPFGAVIIGAVTGMGGGGAARHPSGFASGLLDRRA